MTSSGFLRLRRLRCLRRLRPRVFFVVECTSVRDRSGAVDAAVAIKLEENIKKLLQKFNCIWYSNQFADMKDKYRRRQDEDKDDERMKIKNYIILRTTTTPTTRRRTRQKKISGMFQYGGILYFWIPSSL